MTSALFPLSAVAHTPARGGVGTRRRVRGAGHRGAILISALFSLAFVVHAPAASAFGGVFEGHGIEAILISALFSPAFVVHAPAASALGGVFEEHGIESVQLMKINIEGGEYELLERLVETGLIARVDDIQVQFHNFAADAAARMEQLQRAMRATHTPTYQYRFVWENWRRNRAVSS